MKWNFLEHWDLVTDMRSWAEQDVKIPPLTYCMVVKITCKMYRYLKMKLVGKSQEELSVLVLLLYQQKFSVFFTFIWNDHLKLLNGRQLVVFFMTVQNGACLMGILHRAVHFMFCLASGILYMMIWAKNSVNALAHLLESQKYEKSASCCKLRRVIQGCYLPLAPGFLCTWKTWKSYPSGLEIFVERSPNL